jgi:hypothetical protein
MEDTCLGVSSFFFIGTECDNTHPRNRSVLNILLVLAVPARVGVSVLYLTAQRNNFVRKFSRFVIVLLVSRNLLGTLS